jgi:Protein of unknown function (DUF3298)
MKKVSVYYIILSAIIISLASCTQKTIKTTEKEFSKKYYLSNDTSKGSLNVQIDVELPCDFHEKGVLDSIRATIVSNLFGNEYLNTPNDSVVYLFAKELYSDYKANNEPLLNQLDSGSVYSFNNEHSVEGFSLLSDEHIYVYGIDRNVYMGGAHELETRNYFNFDLKTGKLILEKDLFIPNYENKLAQIIKQGIVDESKEIETMDDLEASVFWTDSIKPNGNFYITDENITYVFNPYEIAPFAYGSTDVKIPFENLKTLLKPNSIIDYLVKNAHK